MRGALRKESEPISFACAVMAKSKNHTAHNQNFKAHRNGIKHESKEGTKMNTKVPSSSYLPPGSESSALFQPCLDCPLLGAPENFADRNGAARDLATGKGQGEGEGDPRAVHSRVGEGPFSLACRGGAGRDGGRCVAGRCRRRMAAHELRAALTPWAQCSGFEARTLRRLNPNPAPGYGS